MRQQKRFAGLSKACHLGAITSITGTMREQKSTIGYDEVALPRPIIPGGEYAAAKAFRGLEQSLPLGGDYLNNGNYVGAKRVLSVMTRLPSHVQSSPEGDLRQQKRSAGLNEACHWVAMTVITGTMRE